MTIPDGFRRYAMSSVRSIGVLCALAVAGCIALSAGAQTTQAWVDRVELLRSQIKTAEEQHASAAQMGGLWLQLANRYQDLLKYPEAEDAFAHSLRLLKGTGAQAGYADALDGMGSLDLATGRAAEGEEFTRNALKLYETLGDRLHAAKMHEDLALDMEFEQRHHDAEAESTEGLTEFHALADPDAGEVVAAYLTRSSALCNMRRYSEAIEDANRAMAVVHAKLPAESLEMVAALMTSGIAEWKSGSPEQGEQAMREALRLAKGLKNLPEPVVVGAQLGVMRQYETLLKASHRKMEANAVEAEMGRLGAEQPAGCKGCTVSAAALAPGLLLP
jgi:tetratricopeptide (TPR) repeat protein